MAKKDQEEQQPEEPEQPAEEAAPSTFDLQFPEADKNDPKPFEA